MELNIPALRKGVSWAKEQEALADDDTRQWDQESWATLNREKRSRLAAKKNKYDPLCGTSMCLGGKTAYDAGWDFFFPESDLTYEGTEHATKDGVTRRINEIAREELGLTEKQANYLFAAGNNASDIETLAESFCEEIGERLNA